MTGINFREYLTTSKPEKALTFGRKRDVGRNSAGRITSSHRGAGHKRLYRLVDFSYDKKNIPATIASIEYDPNRSSFIALAVYADGEKRYVIVPKGLKVGSKFIVGEKVDLKKGNRMMLKHIPVGTFVYNVEVKPRGGAKLIRSAGNFAEVLSSDAGFVSLRMPSTEVRKIDETAYASIGEVSNEEHKLVNFGKAGRSRWMGMRPKVRGTAMNPVDHPYGGGEGRQGRGTKRPKTRTGKVTGGHKSRRPKKYSNFLIVSRRIKKARKK